MNKGTLLLKEETAAQEPSVGACRNTGIHHVGLSVYVYVPSTMRKSRSAPPFISASAAW